MKRYRVTLAAEEREQLHSLLARKADVRKLKHAQILLKADEAAGAPGFRLQVAGVRPRTDPSPLSRPSRLL